MPLASRALRHPCALILCAAALLLAASAAAQDELEDVLSGLGTAEAVGEEAAARPGEGTVLGRVFDASTGQPLERVTVMLEIPGAPGAEPRREVRITDADGGFEFPSVPPGAYQITYIKSGYRNSTMTDFVVEADQLNRADFPLPPLPVGDSGEVLQLEEFVVEAATAAEMMTSLETRLEADQLLNIMSAEDFSKYAAGDVAEALRRVAGVNIVEGQFAIIRGLEDRYSSTLYNSAIVPSPDPDRQSVQLDLFPTEVVTSLNVSKSFSPELPSNSSGGSIDILTLDYPDDIELKLKAGIGYNDNASEFFLKKRGDTDVDFVLTEPTPEDFMVPPLTPEELAAFRRPIGNPVGEESEKTGNWVDDVLDVLETDYVGVLGGRREWADREFRLKLVASREIDFTTAEGFQQGLEPRTEDLFAFGGPRVADLPLGQLVLSDGLYDLVTSEEEEQRTLYGAFGFDLDDPGNHKVDTTFFYTRKFQEIVQHKENGYFPGFVEGTTDIFGRLIDYEFLIDAQETELFNRPDSEGFRDVTTRSTWLARNLRDSYTGPLVDGGLVFGNFFESRVFDRDRELRIYQVQGDHRWDVFPDLHFRWVWNHAETRQQDSGLRSRMFYEPCGFHPTNPCDPGVQRIDQTQISNADFPLTPEELGPGTWYGTALLQLTANMIQEKSDFYRVDGDYEFHFSADSRLKLSAGKWFEKAERDVDTVFLESATLRGDASLAIPGESPLAVGDTIWNQIDILGGPLAGRRFTVTNGFREIDAWYASGKWTLWEKLDLLGGIRRESIFIESQNIPFVKNRAGEIQPRLGGPQTFPSRFVLFDRLDDSFEAPVYPPDPDRTWNDEILGLDVSAFVGPCTNRFTGQPDPDFQCVNLSTVEDVLAAVSGEIDEVFLLPSAGFTFRPIEGLALRGGWSQTVARPSFRELGFYVSAEPGTDDLTVGNPQLQLSEVESWDARLEYTWGGLGDLFAVSWFKKGIDDPVERIVVRDQSNFEFGSGQFRTFFNNPNKADLWGIEAEFRKSFDWAVYLGGPEWLDYLSLGGNFTYIDAEVARTEAELRRSEFYYFGPRPERLPGETDREYDERWNRELEASRGFSLFRFPFSELDETRRLFNQPKWIANADLTFDHPDWGLKATVAYFAISDVLDAAGTASIAPNGDVSGFTLDRYVDSFYELRATVAKTFQLPGDFGELTFRITGKNLTDTPRRILYDPVQTDRDFIEREVRVGRDFDLSLTYTRTF